MLNVSDADEQAVLAWAEAGVGGLLARDVDVDDVAQAVRTTAEGGTVCSPRARRPAAAPRGAIGAGAAR